MKKFCIPTLLMMVVALGANAQTKFSVGPSAGVGISSLSDYSNSKSRMAGNVGISIIYSAVEHFGIGADVKYSFEGVKSDMNNPSREINLQYVRIPLKAIFFFNDYGQKVRPKLFVGPSLGFLTQAKQANGTDLKNTTNSFDLGLLGGAGLHVRLVKNTWFNGDLSYTHGLSNVFETGKNKNRNLAVNVGVNFGL